MPSWSIHLAVAKKINDKLKLDNDVFCYGNLIPDVDKETKIRRYVAHYYDNIPYPTCPKENMINIEKFLLDYKQNINDPLVLGYYCHLLTDSYYNSIVYDKCWVQDENNNIIGIRFKNNKIKKVDKNDKKRIKRKYKHRDFELYGKYLYNDTNLYIPKDSNKIIKHIDKLKNEFLTTDLVNKRIKYLNNEFIKFNKLSLKEKILKNDYKLFSKSNLDIVFDDCVNYILAEFKKVGVKID